MRVILGENNHFVVFAMYEYMCGQFESFEQLRAAQSEVYMERSVYLKDERGSRNFDFTRVKYI